jgi:hypothetical protein
MWELGVGTVLHRRPPGTDLSIDVNHRLPVPAPQSALKGCRSQHHVFLASLFAQMRPREPDRAWWFRRLRAALTGTRAPLVDQTGDSCQPGAGRIYGTRVLLRARCFRVLRLASIGGVACPSDVGVLVVVNWALMVLVALAPVVIVEYPHHVRALATCVGVHWWFHTQSFLFEGISNSMEGCSPAARRDELST